MRPTVRTRRTHEPAVSRRASSPANCTIGSEYGKTTWARLAALARAAPTRRTWSISTRTSIPRETQVTGASGTATSTPASEWIINHDLPLGGPRMSKARINRIAVATVAVVVSIGIGTAIVLAADGADDDTPIPVEPDNGIGDTPDDPGEFGDELDTEAARQNAHGLLGRDEGDLPDDVRVSRRGPEHMDLTEDYRLGRSTVELDDDGDGYRVTAVTVELPDGPETFQLTPG